MMTVLMVRRRTQKRTNTEGRETFPLLMIMNYSDGRPGLDDICG
jgi:hypothetical protein